MELPEVIAHRGGLWEDVGENTLESFRRSADLGLRWIETDVRTSRDNVVYACHDADLRRLAGRPERIRDLPAVEIDAVELVSGGRIPRLSTILEELPDTCFNVDVKSDRATAPMVRLVRRMQVGPRIRLASFSTRRLARLRSALPGVRSSAGTAEVAQFMLAGAAATARFDPGLDSLQVPLRRGPLPVVTTRFVRGAHRAGLAVHVWTINDPSIMRALAGLHVDAIVTDYPELAQRALRRVGNEPGD
ncbi:glycerophosphodiester phosphodiesterase [Brevibacterium daeguense]|uniref:Glycerophosphodiester phosphodiesterase n=1 Tax=Brevibacterium daeguense TaxID=909936 RepID=A0ABP8ENM7_9MICO|nr:glycerophosphodiester phosphodiesterase family protein [Brevibacterium daeguense]